MTEITDGSQRVQPDAPYSSAPRTVGRYEVLRPIARGGMALVCLARHLELDREVALKELSTFRSTDRSMVQRFLQESRLAGSMSHPNIVTVYDYFEQDGTPYIAMEYVPNGSLRHYCGHLDFAQIVGVLEGVLAGLAHAEVKGVVHRDLKPENIMVTSEGRVKIADFGIAKATQAVSTRAFMTATGTAIGTPTYMAPEQAMAREVGPWTDLYSVGVIAYELLVGQPPFHDIEAPMAVLFAHVNEPIVAPDEAVPQLDKALSSWVQDLLAKDPAQRTSSAYVAWDSLEEIAIDLLGPRWRRGARITERQTLAPGAARALTPSPFRGTGFRPSLRAQPEGTDGYMTFDPAPPLLAVAPPQQAPMPAQPASAPAQPAPMPPPPVSAPPRPAASPRVVVPPVVPGFPPAPRGSVPGADADGKQRRISRRRRGATAIVAGAAGVAVTAAAAVAASSHGRGPAPPLSIARSGAISVAYRAPWRRASASPLGSFAVGGGQGNVAPRPPGSSPIMLTSGHASLVAGTVTQSAAVPGGPPPALVARYGTAFNTANARIGRVAARRYAWTTGSSRRLVALVVPTTGSDLAFICSSSTSASSALGHCAGMAASSAISGVRQLAPGPDVGLAAAISHAMAPALSDGLDADGLMAPTLTGRAPSASRLAAAAAASARGVAALSPPERYGPAVSRLSSALGAEAAAFQALRLGASGADRAAYAAASQQLTRAEQAEASAGTSLRALGLAVPEPAVVIAPPAPAPRHRVAVHRRPRSKPSGTVAPSGAAPSPPPSPASPSPSPAPAPAPPPVSHVTPPPSGQTLTSPSL